MTWQLILEVSDTDNIFFMRLVALSIAFLEYKELYGCTTSDMILHIPHLHFASREGFLVVDFRLKFPVLPWPICCGV